LVKLEEEKVILQAEKAKLQKLVAEYEAAIALAKAQMQEYLNRLANAEAQAEIDALKNQAELLKQEKLLAAAAASLEDELRARVTTVWNNYSTAVNNYNTKSVELVKKEAQLAKLQAKAVDNREITYDEIVAQEAKIARLEEELEVMEEYLEMTSDEIKELIEPAREALIAANTAQAEATAIRTAADNEYSTLNGKAKEYEQDWSNNFKIFVNNHSSLSQKFNGVYNKYNQETKRYESGLYFYQEEGTNLSQIFVPLWTNDEYVYGYLEEKEFAIYPEPVEGVRATNTVSIPAVIKFNPAQIFTENFDQYFKVLVDDKKKTAEANKESYKTNYDADVEYVEGKITALKGELAAYSDYVAAAKPEIEEARTALIKADEEVEKADADRKAKQAAYDNYVTSQASISSAAENEKNASDALVIAEENLNKAKKTYADADLKKTETDAQVKLLTDQKFEADTIEAKRHHEYNKAAEKVTPAIEKAKNDAIQAVIDQEGVIATAQTKYEDAVAAYRVAVINYSLNPTEANATIMTTKEGEMKDAEKDVKDEKAKLEGADGLIAKREAAIKAFNDVNDPAEKAKKIWEDAQENATKIANQLGNKADAPSEAENASAWAKYNFAVNAFNTAKANLGTETDPVTGTTYWAIYNNKKEAFEVAHKANPDDSSEYIALYDAWQEAERVYNERVAERATKGPELNQIYNKYREYCWFSSVNYGYEKEVDTALESYIYWDGINVVESTKYKEMDSWTTYESYFSTDVPFLHKPRIAWYEAKLKDLKAQYDKNVAAQEKTVTDLEKEIVKVKEALAGYKAMETDYLAYGEELVNAKKAYYEALKDETDAKNVQSDAQAAYNALNALLTAKVYVDENGNQKTTEQLETLITQKKKDIIAAYEQLEELYNQYEMFGRKDAAGKYEVEYVAQLKIDIEKLEAELAILEAQIESYAAELEILLEELGGEPDVE
jgi:chromosome segregation ATPase